MAEELTEEDLVLPEREFTYVAGSQDRPWQQFTGRWKAIRPHLERAMQAADSDRPLRIVDLGSCTGFFSLQAAHRHPEADVVAIEGSVGVGNGTIGMAGSVRQILSTGAVSTHLRWIQRLNLPNCFVAPEVWDYSRVCDLVSQGRPIADCMFALSVIHHVDNVSLQQYERAGLNRVDGAIDLIGKMLLLSPRHFIELPNTPWLQEVYDRFHTQRAVLEAAALASGREWSFKGPIYSTEWFGIREVWHLEVKVRMPPLDLQTCPFMLLYRGEESELTDAPDDPNNDLGSFDAYGGRAARAAANVPARAPARQGGGSGPAAGGARAGGREGFLDSSLSVNGGLSDPVAEAAALGLLAATAKEGSSISALTSCKGLGGSLVDPMLMLLSSTPSPPVDGVIAEAVASAPTELLLAHLTLRAAMAEAEDVLKEIRGPEAPVLQAQLPVAPPPAQSSQRHLAAPRHTMDVSGVAAWNKGRGPGQQVQQPQQYLPQQRTVAPAPAPPQPRQTLQVHQFQQNTMGVGLAQPVSRQAAGLGYGGLPQQPLAQDRLRLIHLEDNTRVRPSPLPRA